MAQMFEISAEWLKACGKGNKPVTVEIIREQKTYAADDFFGVMYDVRMPDGRTWTVAKGRGRLVAGNIS